VNLQFVTLINGTDFVRGKFNKIFMKKLKKWLLSLFKKTPKPTPSKTPQPPRPTPSPSSVLATIYSYNVNGMEEDINKVCNTGVLTIFSRCSKLEFGCFVFSDSNCTEFETLIGKYFQDYMTDVVYQVQEDGMIINLGRCNP
jgi:hypothetical protein